MVDIFVQVHVGTCGECRRKEPRKRRLEVAPNRTVARAQTPCNGGRTPCRMLCSPTKRQQSNPLEFTNGTMPSTLTISSCNTRGRQILTAARHKTKLRYGLASALHHPAYGMGSICPVCFFFCIFGATSKCTRTSHFRSQDLLYWAQHPAHHRNSKCGLRNVWAWK